MIEQFVFSEDDYPETPGCFLLRGQDGKVLFAGKSVNLRRTLAALFLEEQKPIPQEERLQSSRMSNSAYYEKLVRLVPKVRSIEVFLLRSEADCVAFTNTLIERYHPPFNFATFIEPATGFYLIQTDEVFPRLLPERPAKATQGRHAAKPAARYGPFGSVQAVDLLLSAVNSLFGLRTCDPLPKKACYLYGLKRCSGPCEGWITPEAYAGQVAQAATLLAEPDPGVFNLLEKQMQFAAQAAEFERAARLRDEMKALRQALSQPVSEPNVDRDQDVIYVSQGKALVMRNKSGRLQSIDLLDAPPGADEHACAAFIAAHYQQECPKELICGRLEGAQALAAELTATNGYPVLITIALEGTAADLLETARLNHAFRIRHQ